MTAERDHRIIAISIGDAGGIGPEVTLKALAAELNADATRYVLLGDEGYLQRLNRSLGLGLVWKPFAGSMEHGRLFLRNVVNEPLGRRLPAGSPQAARAAVAWLRDGAHLCLQGKADALVTAPVNKESIIRSGQKSFVGQTEFLSGLAGATQTAMMLLGCDDRNRWLRVALATTHVPLGRVAKSLTSSKIDTAITLAAHACHDLRLPRAKVAVCALNPHAGEGGKMGTEEITVIAPAVRRARRRGLDVVGPLAADALFHSAFRGDFDAVIAMYHDQGLVPLKMIGFETGVNWTLGLPFVRTSPDHGTAYDIAGRNRASPASMISAIRLALRLTAKG